MRSNVTTANKVPAAAAFGRFSDFRRLAIRTLILRAIGAVPRVALDRQMNSPSVPSRSF